MKRLLPLLALLLLCAPARAQDSTQTARRVNVLVTNSSVTGTTLYRLAKLAGAPSKAVVAGTSDTDGVVGVVTFGAGTSGSATIQTAGLSEAGAGGGCAFDNATTAGDYVQISSTAAGKCHDAGSTYPTSGQVMGRVLSTNGSAGTYSILLTPGVKGAPGGDVTGPASSVDSEVALFSGTSGKTLKRASATGIPKLTSGVLGTAVAGTDYENPLTFNSPLSRSTNAVSCPTCVGGSGTTNTLPKFTAAGTVGDSPVSVVAVSGVGSRLYVNAPEIGMLAASKIGGVAVDGLPDDTFAEGFIQWATGLDATMRIDAGENNGLTINAPDSGINITADSGIALSAPQVSISGDVSVNKTVTVGGTTGAQTINKTAGSVNFAAAGTSLVVTNSLVTTSSIITCTVATNDTTFKSAQCVAGSGSFTIFANAAATAETRVNFLVIN